MSHCFCFLILILVLIFVVVMSEGFGQLRSLTSLNLSGDYYKPMSLPSLPESASHVKLFYFLIFVLRRLRTSGQPAKTQHGILCEAESSCK